MKHLKTSMILAASLVMTLILSLAGCDDDHRRHVSYDRDRNHEVYAAPRYDNDRHEDRGGHIVVEEEHRGR